MVLKTTAGQTSPRTCRNAGGLREWSFTRWVAGLSFWLPGVSPPVRNGKPSCHLSQLRNQPASLRLG